MEGNVMAGAFAAQSFTDAPWDKTRATQWGEMKGQAPLSHWQS